MPKLSEGFAYGAEIFHVTVASPTMNHLPLMAFEAWLKHLRQHKGVVCVVPAGNNEERNPCWPGAFPGIVSVGALSTDWRSRCEELDLQPGSGCHRPRRRVSCPPD